MDDHADVEAQEAVDLAHPLRVASRQVVVHGDDVDAAAGERVQIGGERRDEGLALAGLHLGDLALVQDDAADQLDVEVALAQGALAGLAHGGEGLGQQVVEGFAVGETLPEDRRAPGELGVRKLHQVPLEAVDPLDHGKDALQRAIVGAAEDPAKDGGHRGRVYETACGVAIERGRRDLQPESELADRDLVSFAKPRPGRPHAVHEGSVGASQVLDEEALAVPAEGGVGPRERQLREHPIRSGAATDHEPGLVDLELEPLVEAAQHADPGAGRNRPAGRPARALRRRRHGPSDRNAAGRGARPGNAAVRGTVPFFHRSAARPS